VMSRFLAAVRALLAYGIELLVRRVRRPGPMDAASTRILIRRSGSARYYRGVWNLKKVRGLSL